MSAGDGSGGGDPRSRSRGGKVRVKSARGRTSSSTRWLQRQLNDPYVAEAKRVGYRSRAAFKIKEMDEKDELLRGRRRIIDLGAAPGGWTQVAIERTGGKAKIVGIDLLEIDPIPGSELVVMDFLDDDAEDRLIEMLEGERADLVLSDMANSSTGHRQTDHLRTMALCEAALEFAIRVLDENGAFVAKVLRGGTEGEMLKRMRKHFRVVKHVKPPSSRKDSSELYVLAKGFKRS